jgi:hypothetical protein
VPLTVLSNDEIREILVKRIDQQKRAVGIVVAVIEPNGRRVVSYGNLATSDPRTLDGDTIFEIGSVTAGASGADRNRYARRSFTAPLNNRQLSNTII